MQRFKNILCVIEIDSEGSTLERAVTLAENNQACLTVAVVIDETPPNTKLFDRVLSPFDLQTKIVEEYQQRLENLINPCKKRVEIQSKVLIGIPFLEVIKEVLRNDRDLVIKEAEDDELLYGLFGSYDMHLLRKCPCPVWLVKSDSPKVYKRILAAVDVGNYYPPEELNSRNQTNLQILEIACSLAIPDFAELHVVHVWEAIGESALRVGFIQRPEEEVTSYVKELREQNSQNLNILMDEVISKFGQDSLEYLKPITHLLKGSPRKDIPDFANENKIDLVVMGTIARTGISGLIMGNTAETILNKLNCSVLAIKPPGFETPVIVED